MSTAVVRGTLYALFALSGFAGLIYESIWTHYLKLFLGHAAYAQTLVLAIFMGGMALGAWLAGERSRRWRQPLLAYAAVEAILGLLALAFDTIFRGMQAWAFEVAIPALPGPLSIDALKWGLSTLLILPQCVLLGTTFPLMSAGVVRLARAEPGRVLGWLYFTNSAGAAAGVLVSGFVLIEAVGLPGTIRTAGFLNLAIVLLLLPVLRFVAAGAAPEPAAGPTAGQPAAPVRLLLAVACFTGMASFFYEIGWIRMLSLVLGSATHSFELMLAGFILGLALGSAWIRGRIDTLRNPLRALGWIQAVMALLALLSLVLYGSLFEWMEAFITNVAHNDVGYLWFNLFSQALCLALMLPVTICAGMTLPLITATLLRSGGEAVIGRVYAVNTAGAIAGILLAVHVVMPLLGLRQVIVVGAAIDLALGLWLLRGHLSPARLERAALVVLLVAVTAIALSARFEPIRLASGVFRYGAGQLGKEVLFHRDGKTASVDILYGRGSGSLSISTNGKVDAAMSSDRPSTDDYTMVMLGALPLALHPQPRDVAVIGFGSGRTTHVLLHDPRVERVDTIEIEPAMVEAARLFGERVRRAYDDPRSHIHFEDAKTFFARERRRYDVIVSEPSNPWVSGVASLFSEEFYAQARRQLQPGGLFVQWLQLYDIDVALVASVMQALGSHFVDYQIYVSYDADLVIVARADGPVPQPSHESFEAVGPELQELLRYVELQTLDDLRAGRVGGKTALAPLFADYGMPVNSDYFPILDQQAVRYRFLGTDSMDLIRLQPYAWRLEGAIPALPDITPSAALRSRIHRAQADAITQLFAWQAGRGRQPAGALEAPSLREVLVLGTMEGLCDVSAVEQLWQQEFLEFARDDGLFLPPADVRGVVADLRASRCFATAPDSLKDWIALFEAAGTGDHAQVRARAPALLAAIDPDETLPEWAVVSLLEADLRAGEPEMAVQRAREWGGRTTGLGVRLMSAHAAAAQGGNRVQ